MIMTIIMQVIVTIMMMITQSEGWDYAPGDLSGSGGVQWPGVERHGQHQDRACRPQHNSSEAELVRIHHCRGVYCDTAKANLPLETTVFCKNRFLWIAMTGVMTQRDIVTAMSY
jgi:hypothetical protein